MIRPSSDSKKFGIDTTNRIKQELESIIAGENAIDTLTFIIAERIKAKPTLIISPVNLSEREKVVLSLILEGYTNPEIADKLFVSKRTIEGNRKSLMEKTGCKNTACLVKFAIVNNIVTV